MDVVIEGAKCKELEKIIIGEVRVQLPFREKEELIVFIRENIDVFAWNA